MRNLQTRLTATFLSFACAIAPDACFAIGKIVGPQSGGSGGKVTQSLTGIATPAPEVGKVAPDIQWTDAAGKKRSLSQLTADAKAVVLVLRGWPGYQCGICNRQVAEFIDSKAKFEALGAHVVMVYPGPADLLEEHAKEFQSDRVFEGVFHYVIDPDYGFTNSWGLRWDAPRETAYPSTFIVGKGNKVEFANVSKSHGGRVNAARVLKELQQ